MLDYLFSYSLSVQLWTFTKIPAKSCWIKRVFDETLDAELINKKLNGDVQTSCTIVGEDRIGVLYSNPGRYCLPLTLRYCFYITAYAMYFRGAKAKWLLSYKINLVTCINFFEEVLCISYNAYALVKDMNSFLIPSATTKCYRRPVFKP